MAEPDIRELREAVIGFCTTYVPDVTEEQVNDAFEAAAAQVDDELDDFMSFGLCLVSELGADFDDFLNYLQDKGFLESWCVPLDAPTESE